jgi:hypothetical protein
MKTTRFGMLPFMGYRTVLLALLALAGAWVTEAQTNKQPQILFLHLVVTNQAVSLVDSNLRPGVLKPGLEADSTGLFYELVSEAGATLWKGSMADPSVRHLEYEDPANPGKLQRKSVQLDKVEFTLRMPFHQAARRINFFKLASDAPGTARQEASRTSLGSVTLPLNKQPSQ